ncbi:MAG TPA: RNB domain-containing ribonuclease, partial [Candidatus Cloacimonas acidaminovorans]|nr:RNB domain-containing ribonuclease [Candidatus Cloacimonas acidaminovorans]
MNIPINVYVAYFEKGILNFGYVIAQKNNRLEVITETGTYVVLPESRIILQSKEKYLESEPYQALPNFINQVNLFEEQFQESDFRFLKEKECTLQEIATELNLQTDVQIFALFKYLHNHPEKIHYKKNKYRLKTPEEITQYQLQLQQQEEERQFLQDVNAFFSGAELSRESQHKLYNALPELQTAKKYKKLKELILSQDPLLKPEEAILEFRKFCGETPEYIDPVIANAGIPIGFSSLLIEEKLLPWKATQPEAIAFSIDDESTKDFDDAISFTKDGSFWHLTLYVSSVSERLNLEGALFAEAKKRVSSLYTANAVIPLFPFNHSEQELSLKKDSVRPVLALN